MDKFLHHFIRVSDKFLHHFLGWFIVPGFADPGFARGDGLGDGWGDGGGDGRGDGQLSHPPDPQIDDNTPARGGIIMYNGGSAATAAAPAAATDAAPDATIRGGDATYVTPGS